MDIKNKIKSKILLKNNSIRLDKFINEALYDKYGYYQKNKPIGKIKDFITAPEVSQMFGEIIGLYLYYFWETKINSKFNLIELGPGKGTLFADIINALSKKTNFLENAKITFIEINKQLEKIQRKNTGLLSLKNIKWNKKINFKSKIPCIIYSNEFFDCFPVRQFIFNKYWYERYIKFNQGNQNFYFYNKKVNNKNLLLILSKYKKEKLFEVSFERMNYYKKICKHIKNQGGIFLTIDYGYLNKLKNFSLQAIQNHKYSHILENIGEKDISSHVNFNEFLNIAKSYKLKIEEFCTQREFLIKYGILKRTEKLSKSRDLMEIEKELDRLISEKEMGKLFKCIIVSNL